MSEVDLDMLVSAMSDSSDIFTSYLDPETGEIQFDDGDLDLGDDAALATWTALRGTARSTRSSLWVHDEGSWRLLHHQGTPIPAL